MLFAHVCWWIDREFFFGVSDSGYSLHLFLHYSKLVCTVKPCTTTTREPLNILLIRAYIILLPPIMYIQVNHIQCLFHYCSLILFPKPMSLYSFACISFRIWITCRMGWPTKRFWFGCSRCPICRKFFSHNHSLPSSSKFKSGSAFYAASSHSWISLFRVPKLKLVLFFIIHLVSDMDTLHTTHTTLTFLGLWWELTANF